MTITDPTLELEALERRVAELLPPRYQHCYGDVPPNSMGSAGLKYGPDGRIAWDEIWTSFCDLAMAGGPPHRGSLLEPVDPQEVAADPEAYSEVLRELRRAIRLTVGKEVVEGDSEGWIGVPCCSPQESAWLQTAIVAENVSARRQGCLLQLPAGPKFRAEKEVKNVVVALAKSWHYWDGHLTGDQRFADWLGQGPEPASPAEAMAAPGEYRASRTALVSTLEAIAGIAIDAERYAGWIGIACDDEAMAVWLLRAVIAGGVLGRREGTSIYLPVGIGGDSARTANLFVDRLHLWRWRSTWQPREA